MPIEKKCKTCQMYYHCENEKKIPSENICVDWEPEINLYLECAEKGENAEELLGLPKNYKWPINFT